MSSPNLLAIHLDIALVLIISFLFFLFFTATQCANHVATTWKKRKSPRGDHMVNSYTLIHVENVVLITWLPHGIDHVAATWY